ncbi:MAG: flippase-like domain-containing protein [Pseudorhodoplanes sp.]|nr:flippase-like domain-containing protein [Pseudorhodoplanes sp.]
MRLGIDRADPTNRTRFHAIPVAISQIYHGRPHDYTGSRSIAMKFQGDDPLGRLIIQMTRAQVAPDDPPYFWTADDRGLSDFVNGAFRLFGPRVKALYYFWFLLLGVSLAAALIPVPARPRRAGRHRLHHDCDRRRVAALCPCAGAEFWRTVGSHFRSRMFEILGAVAAVHLILVLVRPPHPRRLLEYAALAVQTGLLVFLLHARMSLLWLFATLIMLAATAFAVSWRRGQPSLQPVLVAGALLAGYGALHAYQAATYHPAYKADIGPRVVWHNALMGLSHNPTLAKSINVFKVDDHAAVDAVLNDMKSRSDPRLTPDWNRTTILNSIGGHNSFDWRTYESVARALYLRTVAQHPLATLRMIFWDKPLSILDVVSCRAMLIHCKAAALPQAYFAPLSIAVILLLGLVIAGLCLGMPPSAAASTTGSIAPVIGAAAILALLGLFPSIAFYPAITQLAGTLIFGTLAIYLLIVCGLVFLFAWLFRRRNGRQGDGGSSRSRGLKRRGHEPVKSFALKLTFTLAIALIIIWKIDVSAALARFTMLSPLAIVVCLLLALLQLGLLSYRWMLVGRLTALQVPFAELLRCTLASQFFSQGLPASVGGDALRIWWLARRGIPAGTATQNVLLDRLSGFLALLALNLASLPLLSPCWRTPR